MIRIAVLVSGNGSNLQALLDAQKNGGLNGAEIALVISSRRDAYALERARQAGIETQEVVRKELAADLFDIAICGALSRCNIDLVVLAGFLQVLGPGVLGRYADRILNVHPSLLPSFGGRGLYGIKVHEAALQAGVKVSGATVHLVNEVVDGGPILLQKAVDVLPGDTAESLQQRVMREAEWVLLPQAVAMLAKELAQQKTAAGA